MRIERVNDRQIRCTLTKADLADRQLKISELAYGTEKAKLLFRDMMQQAEYQLGFEAEDIPLMIEAIPLSGEAIVLIITKVEDPEELDTRFSKFAPSVREEMSDGSYYNQEKTAGADDIITNDDGHEIICAIEQLTKVRDALTQKLGDPSEAKVTWIPKNTIAVDENTAKTLFKLIDILEDDDDVQTVIANYELPEGFELD